MTAGPEGPGELAPIDTSPLFRPLLGELVALLRGLRPADWDRPTVAGSWRVRDVAAHVLDGDLRRIAVYRDAHSPPLDAPIKSDRDLARFVNGLNASGVAGRRDSVPGSSSTCWRLPARGAPRWWSHGRLQDAPSLP